MKKEIENRLKWIEDGSSKDILIFNSIPVAYIETDCNGGIYNVQVKVMGLNNEFDKEYRWTNGNVIDVAKDFAKKRVINMIQGLQCQIVNE